MNVDNFNACILIVERHIAALVAVTSESTVNEILQLASMKFRDFFLIAKFFLMTKNLEARNRHYI